MDDPAYCGPYVWFREVLHVLVWAWLLHLQLGVPNPEEEAVALEGLAFASLVVWDIMY